MAGQSICISIVHLACCLVVAHSIYVPETETASTVNLKPLCPETCVCSVQNTSNCVFRDDTYSVKVLKQWRLTRLRINGEEVMTMHEEQDGKQSLQSVIYTEAESLAAEEVQLIFRDVIELHINYVPFQQISVSNLDNFINLTVLNLAHNGITTVQKGSFDHLLKLKVLNLEENRISALPDGIFSKLTNLRNLSLNGNKLKTLPSEIFNFLGKLENLYLQSNELVMLDTFIYSLNNITTLNIRNNKLSYVLPDSVDKLTTFREVLMSENPFQCTCVIVPLKIAVQNYPSVFKSDLSCDGPIGLSGENILNITDDELECYPSNVITVSAPSYGIYQDEITITCYVFGTPPYGLYWITPWGDKFASPLTQIVFPKETEGAFVDRNYHGINLLMNSHVHSFENGTLHIDKFRGYLSGEFTCVSVSLIGQSSNKSVTIKPATKLQSLYLTSLVIGAICASSALIIAIFIGAVRWFVSKCMHSKGCNCCCCKSDEYDLNDKYKIEETQTVEITYAARDPCHSLDEPDFDPDSCPPTVPVNSPQLRKSPEKCPTPAIDLSESDKSTSHIWDQLEEVRARLRCGAERKIEKVRSHVRSFTDSGKSRIWFV